MVKTKFSKEKKTELIEALKKICDDYDFIIGIRSLLKNDADIDEVLDYIRNNENLTSSDIILLSLEISRRNPKN